MHDPFRGSRLNRSNRLDCRLKSESRLVIAKLKAYGRIQAPTTDISEFHSESDVEQKLVYPFLVHPSFMDIPPEWVRTHALFSETGRIPFRCASTPVLCQLR